MSQAAAQERLTLKTPEAAFLNVLQQEFNFSLRVSHELLTTAQEMLLGSTPATAVRPGQVRQVVASLKAPFGPPLAEADKVEVTLTVDAGAEDAEVKARQGAEGLRRGQILRLIEEALEQGGVLTQEDLGRALKVSARTIRRDVQALKVEGYLVHTRGQVKGVGRGQTHKVRIIELWLDRIGYGQIVRQTYHSQQSVKRYISTFLRIVVLHQKGVPVEEIAFLTQSSQRLVQDYLEVYQAAREAPHRREKLEEELARVSQKRGSSQDRRPRVPREGGKKGEVSR
jgi:DNA-binding Lrp family transcriptional regulator